MRSKLTCFIMAILINNGSIAQAEVNYVENAIDPYVLPELLVQNNGKRVTTVAQWENTRRNEILDLYINEI